jgi:tetratricopeptide (TPR) repeat protein
MCSADRAPPESLLVKVCGFDAFLGRSSGREKCQRFIAHQSGRAIQTFLACHCTKAINLQSAATTSTVLAALCLKKNPMNEINLRRTALTFGALILIITTIWMVRWLSLFQIEGPVSATPRSLSIVQKSTRTNRLIKQAELGVKVSPDAADNYNLLAAAYIEKARETGDFTFNARAESAVARALELAPDNFEAIKMRATLLLTYHRFGDALGLARQAQKINPQDATVYGAMTDALVELGRYDEAQQAVEQMLRLKPDTSSYCRASYLRFLQGDPQGALSSMQEAVRYANPQDRETVAWTRVHLGDEYLNAGKTNEAIEQYNLALEALPDYHLALVGQARTAIRTGDMESAIRFYQQSQTRVPSPDTAIALGDLLSKTGQTSEAQKQYALVEFIETSASSEAQTYSRTLATFYANHDLKLDEALAIARAERKERADIYTCDALAWCLFKKGMLSEARQAMTEALRLGTRDPHIHYHAGLIHHALGNKEKAAKHLQLALEINPVFDVLQADLAKQKLAEVRKSF